MVYVLIQRGPGWSHFLSIYLSISLSICLSKSLDLLIWINMQNHRKQISLLNICLCPSNQLPVHVYLDIKLNHLSS